MKNESSNPRRFIWPGATCTLERRAYQAAAHLATACAAAAAGPIRARHDSTAVRVSGGWLRDDPLLAFCGRRRVQHALRVGCRHLADQPRHPLAVVDPHALRDSLRSP